MSVRRRWLAMLCCLAFASPALAQHAGHAMPEVPAEDAADEPAVDHSTMDHSTMDHAAMGHAPPVAALPRTPIPAITAADRTAAFPDIAGHAVHDKAVHWYVLLDQLETRDVNHGDDAFAWDAIAWIGTDIDRLWLRTEGDAPGLEVESATVEVLYGRAVAPWWDVVAGVRHDAGEGPSRTFAALGVMGLAPGKFEVEATGYLGQSGHAFAELEVEYETLVTNRLILQWMGAVEVHARDDAARGIGTGLSTIEAGLRLRYEVTRRFAPYIGVAWERAQGETADLRRATGLESRDASLVVGIRTWF